MKPIRHLLSIISSALSLIIFNSQQTNSEPSLLHLLHHGDGGLKSGCCRKVLQWTWQLFECRCNVYVLRRDQVLEHSGLKTRSLLFSLLWLWQVPADLQNEVLMSLLETDCDVVDYLLRRKASQNLWDSRILCLKCLKWAVHLHVFTCGSMCLLCLVREPAGLQAGGPFSVNVHLKQRRLSSNSVKVSSGDVSPYDNNSPVLSDGLMAKYPEDSDVFSPRPSFTVHSTEGSSRNSPTLSKDKGAKLCSIDG